MARKVRVEFEGAYYHVCCRGNERKEIFRGNQDRELFLKTLVEMLEQFGVVLHCYCLMPNHYHLVIQTPRGNLSRAMAWFQTTYTARYNRKHKRSGHLFQGRYKAHLIEADAYAVELIPYIHLNPVRLRDKALPIPAERKEKLENYPWSSHAYYSGKKKAPCWLNLDWLSYWGKSRKKAQRQYRKDIQEVFTKGLVDPMEQLRGGLVLGGEALWEKAQILLGQEKGKEQIRWKQYHDQQALEAQIRKIVAEQKDSRLRLWVRVRLGGQKLIDLAQEEGYRDGSGIYRVVTRLEKAAQGDARLNKKLQELRRSTSIVVD